MTITYSLDFDDYLAHQLYVSSKSVRTNKTRKRIKLIIPVVFTVLGCLYLMEHNITRAIWHYLIAVAMYFLYPLWEKIYYKKHYKGFIKENYANRLGKDSTLEFSNDFIIAIDDGSESKVRTSEIVEINEIPTVILIRLKDGQSFILSKNKIATIDEVISELKHLAAILNIPYNTDNTWTWK